ncbi:MAG: four helix bundle protein [Gemmatimonadaceae bacterium]|nr:four helix bundle protein [Gemmatimonadaceae bacterium]
MQDFRKLRVWQRAQDLAAQIHLATVSSTRVAGGPWRSQVRRASASIAANIAEGTMKGSPRHFAQFLEISIGSASETESHLDFSIRIGLLTPEEAEPMIQEVVAIRRMLVALRRRVLERASP